MGRGSGVKVTDDIAKTIKASKPDVAVLCTSSSLEEGGAGVRGRAQAEGADRLDDRGAGLSGEEQRRGRAEDRRAGAKRARVAVLGTGVNPGFAMDALPIALTGVCEQVTAIEVDRVQDAQHPAAAVSAEDRRRPDARAVSGARSRTARVRHVGLAESITMIADALGLEARQGHRRDPAEDGAETVTSEFLTVEPGQVCGIIQDGVGYRRATPIIKLHMEAYLGAPESYDAVRIDFCGGERSATHAMH